MSTWQDIDFAKKRIDLRQQISYRGKQGYYFDTLKSKSSYRYIIIDDFLLGELLRWQNQQIENKKQFGNSYVYIYCEDDEHVIRQSKGLPISNVEKVSLVCIHYDGRLVLKVTLTKMLRGEGLNSISFRHTHGFDGVRCKAGRRIGTFRAQESATYTEYLRS